MDLNVLVNQELLKLQEEGYVETIIKEQLKSTIKSIIESSLRSYSTFGKELEKQVEELLNVNLKSLDIPSYNHVILNIIKQEIDRSIHDVGSTKIKEQLEDMLGTGKNEYKLSELIQEMVEFEMELGELEYDEVTEISVHVHQTAGGLTWVYLDPVEDKSKYECKYRITLDDNIVSGAMIGENCFDNSVILGGLHGLEETIFKMFTNGSKLIIDEYKTEFTNPSFE
ncbi:hypothetical protein TCA2_4425 [Paenibacillus sp. TCA20]|uniref:hypothetical protein n=1 Tax=Paenibacillus sp. TCA20 TaxID=1499968 RepID=UPI0004D81BDB|nr:hypothetical protein [Paenibacillus sp. TCA20]GAK41933.1 hypothetical protein TCA2_4425 [Paenibacillus sp. TCA20]